MSGGDPMAAACDAAHPLFAFVMAPPRLWETQWYRARRAISITIKAAVRGNCAGYGGHGQKALVRRRLGESSAPSFHSSDARP